MSLRRAGCLAVLGVVSVFLLIIDNAFCMTIEPAAFDHILAEVPKEVMAGVEFEVAVTFVDRYGNPMSATWKPESSLTLNVSQPASVQPSILTPDNYVPGFTFTVRTEKMGELTLSLRNEKAMVLDQWDLTIKSGRPEKLLVDLPSKAEVGETINLALKAVDAHGNVAFGYAPQVQSMVIEESTASVAGEITSKAGGVYVLPIKFRDHGKLAVTLRDRRNGLSGSSAAVDVTPAPLGSFDIKTTTDQSVAGQEFALTIRALDRYGNLVTDYDSRYRGVRLVSQTADVTPDLLPPSAFSDGVARIGLVIKAAGNQIVKVSELQSSISGDFKVRIVPADVKVLKVMTPDSAVAGEPFEITVISEDQFGNRSSSLPAGTVVRLNSTGTGTINPGTVDRSAFKDGAARIKVSYEKAESFEILAQLSDTGKSPAASPLVDEKEKARISAQKAREEAMRARREARLREKRVSTKISQVEQPRSTAAAGIGKKAPEPVKKEKPSQASRPSPVKKTAPVKTPVSKAPVVASKKTLRPGILDKIAVTEEGSMALVTFSTNGMTDYNVTTSAKLSRKWIDIEFPDMVVELPDRIGGGDKVVGEVYVEPSIGDGPGVRVSIEILPTRIGYDVFQDGNTLVLKVNKQ